MLYNGASIREYKAYWHINFSLINGCGTHKNINHGHSFCKFTNIIHYSSTVYRDHVVSHASTIKVWYHSIQSLVWWKPFKIICVGNHLWLRK